MCCNQFRYSDLDWLKDGPPAPQFVDPEQALRLQDRREAILVDCRDPVGVGNEAGYCEGAAEGSVNLPAATFIMFPDKVYATMEKLKSEHPDATLILMSNTGEKEGKGAGRCKFVAIQMHTHELWEASKLLRLEGGFNAWKATGLPIVLPRR